MKIECDKCSAKYSIADEKVRGKTFKIRCKKCSNVIIVRDKAAGAGLGGEAEAPAAVGWHLAINGETVGPMPEDEVRQRFRAGEIDRETAIWQEGFEDWMPLGDVEAFADLAAGEAAAEDPFASANQEEYAAPAVQARAVSHSAAPVARVAGAGGASVSEAQGSPRVSRLTGQRNENSVLFSLDSLQALATGGNAANTQRGGGGGAPQRSGPKGLATVAPSSEGSGLIDIRSLGAMVGADAGPTPVHSAPKHDDAALPSFGGASLGGLASAPLVPQVASVDHMGGSMGAVVAPPQQRSNAPMYVMMVILLLAVAGLGAYIVLRPTEPVIVEKTVQSDAPSVRGDDKDEDEDDKDKKDKDEDDKAKAEGDDPDKAKDGEEAGDAKDEAGAEEGKTDEKVDEKSGSKPSGSKPSGSKPSGSKPSGSTPVSKPSGSTPAPASKPSSGADLDVDCILDPKLPKCKGGGTKPSGGATNPKPAAPSDPSLPETLSTADIKAGVAPYKDAAKACGSKHGAAPGDKVKVKLSIAGATGAVSSASAEPPHNGTPLGNCVAAALKKATFKKFRKPSLGAVYPVTM